MLLSTEPFLQPIWKSFLKMLKAERTGNAELKLGQVSVIGVSEEGVWLRRQVTRIQDWFCPVKF